MILKVNPRAGLAQRGTPVPAGTGDLTIYRVVHANFPKFFLKFFVKDFPAPDIVHLEGMQQLRIIQQLALLVMVEKLT